MNINKKKPSILGTNILYLIVALLLIFLGAKVQYNEIYTGLLITEYIIILLPVIFYLKFGGYSIKNTLRLNKISFKQSIKVIFIVLFSYPVAVFFNFIGIMLLGKFGKIMPNPVPIPTTINQYLISFFIIALSPGICEEIMFRGMIMSSYEQLGKKKAIIYSAILFGVFHFNFQNLLGPIYLGILFGIIAYKTNSLFSTIIGHTVNNTIALTIGYLTSNLNMEIGEAAFVELPSMEEMIISFIGLGILALIFGFIVYKLIKSLSVAEENEIVDINNLISEQFFIEDINKREKMSIIEKIPVLIVISLFIIWNYKYFFV